MSLRDTSTTMEFGCPKRANFNVISIYKKEINFYGMYALSNEALQGHLEALYEPQIVSVGSSEPPKKKTSSKRKFTGANYFVLCI